MADLELVRLSAAELRDSVAELNQRHRDANQRLHAARAGLAAARADADQAAVDQARADVEALVAERRELTRERGELHDRFAADLQVLLGDGIDLEGDVPIVLLPVRIECRSTPDLARLRVRIFPDGVHTEALDEGVTDTERTAGTAYWTAVWADGDPDQHWPILVAAVGSRRAPWVAEVLRPRNLAERPGGDPAFPDPAPAAGTHAVARTLPDRFHVRVEQDGVEPVTVVGPYIPDEIPVGLVDAVDLSPLQVDGHELPPIDESLAWLVDYAEAERLGMAVTVDLPVPGQPVRRLSVYGVRSSLPAAEAASHLERLVRSHRFTDGAEFLAQGTPTNNTDSARSSWSRQTPLAAPALAGADALSGGANGAVTAEALGVSAGLLATLPNAADAEQVRAGAFHTALWDTTWGEAIETLSPAGRNNGDKRLDNRSLSAVRRHWVDYVRGRGPLPAVRFGRQPYGLLPVVATADWRPLGGGFAERTLVPFLERSVRWMWDDAVEAVTTVLNTALDEALPEILGTDAVLRALRVRSAVTPDPTFETATAIVLPVAAPGATKSQVARTILVLSGVSPDSLEDGLLIGKKTRSLALPLVDPTDQEFVRNLLEAVPAPASPKSVLQVLLAHAHELAEDAKNTVLHPEFVAPLFGAVDGATVDIDRNVVMAALDAVANGAFDDGSVVEAGRHLDRAVGRLDLGAVRARNPVPAFAPAALIQQVAGIEPRTELLRNELGMQLVGEVFHQSWRLAELHEALRVIAAIDALDERRLLLSETLDCCSHRLDAWLTSAATMRLAELRARGGQGSHLGAYGWLDDIVLRAPVPTGQVDGADVLHEQTDGGYVHAPGLTAAATAGVLRSGRLTHRRGDPHEEALDIDLSSARVRDALALLDGMNNGQSLGALLGYRLERRLHDWPDPDVELDRFIYVLRTLAPLRAGKLTAPDQPVDEGMAAALVVDGLKISELAWPTIAAALVAGPQDNTYIPPGSWVPPGPGEVEAVQQAIAELESTHDAVADLLLAESVHQVVSGNPARAAAALDLLGAGEAAPPEVEVVRTPRSGTPLQHRIAIAIADPPPAPRPGWDVTQPRAEAEPRLECWAQRVFADPGALLVTAGGQTLADAGLCALDVVFDSDGDSAGASTLAGRVRLALDAEVDAEALAPWWELAGLLRGVLTRGRALAVADTGGRECPEHVGRTPDTVDLLNRAAGAKDRLALAIQEGTAPALAPFGVTAPAGSAGTPLQPEEQAVALAALLADADRRVAEAEALLARTAAAGEEPPPPQTVVELAAQALAAVFGAGFLALPVIRPAPAGEPDRWADALGPAGVSARPGADIRPWLQRAGALRDATAAYGETLLVRDAFGLLTSLRVAQTPAAAYPTWVGLPWSDAIGPRVPVSSVVLEQVGADLTGAIAGMVLDEWSEVVPKRLERFDPADPDEPAEVVDVTTTGIALNANAPGARPPQTVLLAMTPDGGSWTEDRLVAVLNEVQALARMRCVTLDQVPYAGTYLPALYFRDWSLQGEPAIDWLKVATEFTTDSVADFLKVDE